MAASVGSALVPESIGVVGVGTISSAAVRGLCRSSNAQFVLSPRNAEKAKALDTHIGVWRAQPHISISSNVQKVRQIEGDR